MSGWERVEREQANLVTQSMDPAWWRDYFADHPEVLHHLLADLYRASTSSKERPSNLDELWGLVNPTFSNDTFGDAVRTLLGSRSIRWLAGKLHMDHSALVRIINGERTLINIHEPERGMLRLEAVARALKVHPSYFLEWRRLWILSLLDTAFEEQPHLSVGVYRKFAAHQTRPRRSPTSERTFTA